jgi:protein-L-isoaspartate(D-aspartate) O-methyltransferase
MIDKNQLLEQLQLEGIHHPKVLAAIKQVPRENFVLSSYVESAYENSALPIQCQQTISQPYIVALMTQALFAHPHPKKILEIGTGSGYQAAILATLFEEVYTIEVIKTLHENAKKTLSTLGFKNIHYKLGDGSQGWAKHAPFDCIIVTAAATSIPEALLEELEPDNGIMVIPVGEPHHGQTLWVIKKQGDVIEKTPIEMVCFVPLVHK